MLTLVLSITGLLITATAFAFGGLWGNLIGSVATLVSAWAMLRQYKETKVFELVFDEKSWQKKEAIEYANQTEYGISITASKHRKGKSPIFAVYKKADDGEFSIVGVEKNISISGDMTIASKLPFDGKVVIK